MMAVGVTAYSPSAQACGGLFCNNSQPVNQAAERIIFSDNPDDTVTAVVQIMYEGPSERFAWVLPVPGTPEVGVSSNQALDRLQQATNPSYRMNTTVEGTCSTSGGVAFGSADASENSSGNNGSTSREEGGVEVVDSGHVGPYDYTTISVRPGGDDPAAEALEWLGTNNYDVSALGEETIRPYLEDGMNLLAFRLSKDSNTGDIRPVRLTYDAELPMIPIKLTAVAANDNMGVMTWVLSDTRAVPSNYKSLELNQAAINWFTPSANYNDVVNRAADEADGQGFVTEFAWPTSRDIPSSNQFSGPVSAEELVFGSGEQQAWDDIKNNDWTNQEGQLLQRTMRYNTWDGFLKVVDATVPLPSGSTAQEYARCSTSACDRLIGQQDIENFDAQTYIDQLELQVVEPMSAVQELIDARSYMTRMYTTMSAADMTLDPVFDVNSSLGDHSHVHVAERVIECGDEAYSRNEAPWRVALPQGDTVFGTGNTWPLTASDSMPANRTIVQARSSGQGEIVVDNTDEIDNTITRHNQQVTDRVSGGCQVTHPASVSLARNLSIALMFGAFGLLLIRVRRRD
jgi:hypothetical protein